MYWEARRHRRKVRRAERKLFNRTLRSLTPVQPKLLEWSDWLRKLAAELKLPVKVLGIEPVEKAMTKLFSSVRVYQNHGGLDWVIIARQENAVVPWVRLSFVQDIWAADESFDGLAWRRIAYGPDRP